MIALHCQHNIPFPEKKHPSFQSFSKFEVFKGAAESQERQLKIIFHAPGSAAGVQTFSKIWKKNSLTPSIHPPRSFTHKLWRWTTHHEKSNKTYLSFKLNPSFGSVSTTIFPKRKLDGFFTKHFTPQNCPSKKQKNSQILQTSRKKPMRGWPGTGLRVLFNSVLHFHKTINFPKENCAKIIRPSSSFEKSTTIDSKWHLLFKGILRLLQHPGDPDAFARPKKSSSNWTNTWGLSKFLIRFVEAMLNSSQDRLLQMSSYVAILETAKRLLFKMYVVGCYSVRLATSKRSRKGQKISEFHRKKHR